MQMDIIVEAGDSEDVVDVLKKGSLYGEINLVSPMPSKVAIRANTFTDILVLTKAALDDTVQVHFTYSSVFILED